MATTLESLPVLGDLIKMELDHRYCRVGVKPAQLTTALDPPPVSVLGFPVAIAANGSMTVLQAGGEAQCNGLVLDQRRVQETTWAEFITRVRGIAVMNQGPAIVNRAALPTLDHASVVFDVDAIVAALAVVGIKVIDEHTQQNIQTT